jgi:glycosyltransferase involved in cell wall biosynthesis
VYLRNLVYALASLPADERPEIELVGVSDTGSPLADEVQALDLGRRVGGVQAKASGEKPSLISSLALWLLDKRRGSQAATGGDGPEILYPAGFGLEMPNVARLFWIADFQHAHLPHLFPVSEIEARQRGMADIARQDAILVLSSRSALNDFRALFPDAVVRPRIWSFCSSFGPDEEGGADPREAHGVPEKFLYVPNQFWAHKDHLTVFRALALLSRKGIRPPVVCTGLEEDFRVPGHFRSLREYVTREGLDSTVRFLGQVPRRDQVQIFRLAAAVVQPSLFEGWSTVVEDAKALGRSLILSDIPTHGEQAGEIAAFFRAGSPEALAKVVEDLWPRLAPGPDLASERAARARTDRRRLEVGRTFMGIVHEALGEGASVPRSGGPARS